MCARVRARACASSARVVCLLNATVPFSLLVSERVEDGVGTVCFWVCVCAE